MSGEQHVVLPDTLVAQLIDNAATLNSHLQADFVEVTRQRDSLRNRLIDEKRIIRIEPPKELPAFKAYAIDGAHLPEIDRASAYSASCAVRVGQAHQDNAHSSCLAILPHVPCLNALSSGFMMMQEIMMSVQVVEQFPDALCLVDGSRISSAIISVNQFYASILRDMPQQIRHWRQQAVQEPTREPGRTLALFESRDWLTPYLTSARIIGNLKLVTSTALVEKYVPHWVGRFDDKTFAALVLETGEILSPEPLPPPESYYHINDTYPFARNLSAIERSLYESGHANQIWHIYYRPDVSHGIFKIEMNRTFLNQQELVAGLLAWWRSEISSADLQEPYSFYIADRFAKEAVSVSRKALKEITRRDIETSSWAWFFTQPYRTE